MIEVRAVVPDDVPVLIDLLDEMDRYYGATDLDPRDVRRDQIRDALFGGCPAAGSVDS